MAEPTRPLLTVRGLRKSFGAVKATDGVDLDLAEGEIHALIGPNGAGKSTLIAQLCGEQRPDAGSITLDGTDVTALPAHLRARRGLSRSFQITELCADYTALEKRGAVADAEDGPRVRCLGRSAARRGPGGRGAAQAGRGGAGRPRRRLRGRPGARREAPTGAGRGPGAPAAAAVAGRAHGRHGRRRIGAHDDAAAGPEAALHHPAGGTRHGRGVRAGRPHHRAGLRPHHLHRHAGGRARQTPRCVPPTWGRKQHAERRGTHGRLWRQPGAVRHGLPGAGGAGRVADRPQRHGQRPPPCAR